MNTILSALISIKTTVILLLIFAFASGYATFIENDYGTITAKADIYNARWFEVLMIFLTLNLISNIYRFKMYTLKKAPVFIFHIAFVVIIIGAAVTRYAGYEGIMHIREGASADTMVSSDTFFTVKASLGDKSVEDVQKVYLSKKFNNNLYASLEIDEKIVNIDLVRYIPDVIEKTVEDENGIPYASMMVTGGDKGKVILLSLGSFYETDTFVLDFQSGKKFDKKVISLYMENDNLMMSYDFSMNFLKMNNQSTGILEPNIKEPLVQRTLFSFDGGGFVLRSIMPKASKKLISNPDASAQRPQYDAFEFNISSAGESKNIFIYGQAGILATDYHFNINGLHLDISYGSKTINLPFKIELVDFDLDRYPGSMSPASYASDVKLIDTKEGINRPYRIYMNNILEHKGYRFFQSSYDQDEKGTVLSVNNDPGTLPSYIGYFLLALGMFWSLFSKKNRFSKLAQKAKESSIASFVALLFVLVASPSFSDDTIDTILNFDNKHTKQFGKLIVQDNGGRMKPLDTLATEILSKIHKSSTLKIADTTLSADNVILGMFVKPNIYKDIKFIYTKNEEINRLVGARKNAKYVSFSQFFEDPLYTRGYRLAKVIEEAIRKTPKHRTKLDKALLEIDERVNIAYMVYSGSIIKIWPKQDDANNKWHGTIDAIETFTPKESSELQLLALRYFTSINNSLQDGDWTKANEALEKISHYQKKHGADVYLSENRIKAEVFYNETKIFENLYPLYLLLGFILLVLSFVRILKPSFNINIYMKISLGFLIVFFIAHTIGLANRWYISGHAPWSNGYESMIYIGWATVFAGFIFSKKSPMTMSSTGILTGLILFVAHLNWMNPQITNLVPVLNSYWLSIHVSMITASYGFLGLGALLGFIVILLFILKTKKNKIQITTSIKELSAINEMSLMAGLVLLTVGNFLGGVWANESWGRYWGWDPKETWALVTILVYAAILHIRFIKSIYNEYSFAVISLLAYSTVIMTYFGVNYYLAGLHSYAKGDPVPIPDFVPITYAIIFIVIIVAFRNRKLN